MVTEICFNHLFPLNLFNSLGFLAFTMQLIQKLAAYTAGRKLHWIILIGVLHAPMSFFDTTPIGRIINRFAKEIESVDTALPSAFSQALTTLVTVIATFIILIYGSWFAIIAFIPLAIVFGYTQVKMHVVEYFYMICSLFASVFICRLLVNFVVSIQFREVRYMRTLVRQFKVSAQFELIMHSNVLLIYPINSWTEINRVILLALLLTGLISSM